MRFYTQIFKPLRAASDTFQKNKIGDCVSAISYTYRKKFYDVGEFTLILPSDCPAAATIGINTLLFADRTDWLIVRNVRREQSQYTITGYDLCGLLKDRITLYGAEQDVGAYGYDVVQGSTETVAKHYITNNIAEPTDPNRKVIGFTVAADQNRGLAEDTYMSRFEFLSDLEEKVCKNGGIGYDITVDLAKNAMIFDVLPIVDKTESQSERNRVVFAVERRNVLSLTHEFGATNSKNVFYATKSGGTLEADATTIMVADGDTAASGIDRREMQLNVSCDSISEVSKYALKDVENYRETESFEVSPADLSEYGKVYSVGDKVTVRSTLYGITMDAVITEAEKSVTSTGRTIAVTLGEAKPKPLDQIYQAIENKGV